MSSGASSSTACLLCSELADCCGVGMNGVPLATALVLSSEASPCLATPQQRHCSSVTKVSLLFAIAMPDSSSLISLIMMFKLLRPSLQRCLICSGEDQDLYSKKGTTTQCNAMLKFRQGNGQPHEAGNATQHEGFWRRHSRTCLASTLRTVTMHRNHPYLLQMMQGTSCRFLLVYCLGSGTI